MKNCLLALLVVFAGALHGQTKQTFRLAPAARYAPGRVLVKVKTEFRETVAQLARNGASSRVKDISVRSVAPVVKPELARRGAALRAPRVFNPVIDISRYYSIHFDAGQNMEAFINKLYATGYFEIVEPEYAAQTDFTPNDPQIASQYYLGRINAFQAWDVTRGDTSVTIAVVDAGGELNHPDISPNLYRNWAEYPPNGIDDDGNGFIDDYQGWDFIGADTANLATGNLPGDNNPNVVHGGLQSHGTWVAGCASGATNNGIGIAGVGFKTRIMFTKHSADNQNQNNGGVYLGYSGVLYAANMGVRIINLSWGGPDRSQIIQDLITHVSVDLGCLVIAAAGNSGSSSPFYPAAYDHVLSVAASDANDVHASFTNFGNTIDLTAPGVGITTTGFGPTYNTVDGTSFSSPITAGAAALVWAANPGLTGAEVGERLRVSADGTSLYAKNNGTYANKLGKGRLDVAAALTVHSPSIRASNPVLILADTVTGKSYLSFDFTNLLENSSPGLSIVVSGGGSGITYGKNTISPGMIASGATFSNKPDPFVVFINPAIAENTTISFQLTYTDGSYDDVQFIDQIINPSFINVQVNQVSTTMTNIGRIGFQQPETSIEGLGFVFNSQELLFEMGLLMGSSTNDLLDNIRGLHGVFDEDFVSRQKIHESTPGQRSASEVSGGFTNSSSPANQTVSINYRSLAWKNAPYDKFVIVEFQIKNISATPMSNWHFGIFADWDITASNDAADWSDPEKLGYVYSPAAVNPYAGLQILNGSPGYYAIENDQNVPGNPFGLYDDFTDPEKVVSLTQNRLQAGVQLAAGTDVSHVVSSGPHNIAPGETLTLAFAIHGAANLNDLRTSAQWADSLYNFTLQAPRPIADSAATCYGSAATLNASGAAMIKWYPTFTGGTSFFTGNQFTTGNLFHDTTLYVSNADHSYESVRTSVVVSAKANPTVSVAGSLTFCEGNSVILSVSPADSILWNTGATTPTIMVADSGAFFVTVKDATLHCQSTSATLMTHVDERPVAGFVIQGDLLQSSPLSFVDESSGAVSWSWDFGDGQNSQAESPQHSYSQHDDYDVVLRVANAKGCTDSTKKSISIITGLATESGAISLYPNPVVSQTVELAYPAGAGASMSITNSVGQLMLERVLPATGAATVSMTTFPAGLYVIRLRIGDRTVSRKVIKAD